MHDRSSILVMVVVEAEVTKKSRTHRVQAVAVAGSHGMAQQMAELADGHLAGW